MAYRSMESGWSCWLGILPQVTHKIGVPEVCASRATMILGKTVQQSSESNQYCFFVGNVPEEVGHSRISHSLSVIQVREYVNKGNNQLNQ